MYIYAVLSSCHLSHPQLLPAETCPVQENISSYRQAAIMPLEILDRWPRRERCLLSAVCFRPITFPLSGPRRFENAILHGHERCLGTELSSSFFHPSQVNFDETTETRKKLLLIGILTAQLCARSLSRYKLQVLNRYQPDDTLPLAVQTGASQSSSICGYSVIILWRFFGSL